MKTSHLHVPVRQHRNMSVARLFKRLLLVTLAPLLVLAATGGMALAQSPGGDLLPVTEAFRLSANADTPGQIRLHWDIAKDYYLYRGRIHVKVLGDAVQPGELDLPEGEKEHDPYLGDVVIYHHGMDATLPYTVLDATQSKVRLTVQFQGCHEVDPKICYPPHTETLNLALPATTTATAPNGGTETLSPTRALARGTTLPGGHAGTSKPLPPGQAFRFEAIASGPDQLLLRWVMPKGYYLYRDKTQLTLVDSQGITLGTPQWPTGTAHHDDYFGSSIVYFNEVDVPLPLERGADGASQLTLQASFQGCQDHGICYPPITRKVDVALPASTTSAASDGSQANVTAVGPAEDASLSSVDKLAGGLAGNGRWLALLGFFAAGLALAFTPCVLPMIPILSGLIAGAGKHISTARAFVLSLVYVLASSLVFVIAGIVAGLVGTSVQAAFQSPWLLGAFALLFVLLALSMFGFYELRAPAALQKRVTAASNRQQGGSLVGVAVMGVLSALIVGPCVAPPLAGAVLYIAQTHDPVFGALALFLLSLGMGAPLIVFGMAAGRWLPHAGAWMKTVQAVFGVIFLGLAIWMLSRFLDPLWIMLMTGVLLIASAVYMGALDHMTAGSGWRKLWKACGLVLLVLGAAQIVGVMAGSNNLLQPLAGLRGGNVAATAASKPVFKRIKTVADLRQAVAAASAQGKPVMMDFYADWCTSCKEMEHFTFTQPAVSQAMSHFVLLQADVTANDDADRALLKHFGLFGPPAILFYNTDGTEMRSLRLIGFEKGSTFNKRLHKAEQG